MSWKSWREYYENNRDRPLPELTSEGVPADAALRRALARSFAVFQLGEAGEGRIARQIHETELEGIDADYRVALEHWVREEGKHGGLLGRCVKKLGGKEVAENWTNGLLIWGRRLAGVRLKLLVILSAEVVGIVFYGLIARALPPGSIPRALAYIAEEERAHLRFHATFFRSQASTPLRRLVFGAAWWLVGLSACAVVVIDHARTLRSLGIPVARAGTEFVKLLATVQQTVTTAETLHVSREPLTRAA